jgi:hypothetical protein
MTIIIYLNYFQETWVNIFLKKILEINSHLFF